MLFKNLSGPQKIFLFLIYQVAWKKWNQWYLAHCRH